ncbi:hypothetical protein [Bordetella sp. LUAb4]|uniref:hypothetical protein n=1 Tax=Bordetella sp. LUAb4 TaxID=2843195 RepID=UPI001E58434C|nr:hypothetical protein [Bordetella sp. LUAb4]
MARVADRSSSRGGNAGCIYSATGSDCSASSTSVDSDLAAELRFPINFSKAGTPRAVVHPAHEAAKYCDAATAVLLRGERRWSTYYYANAPLECPDNDPVLLRLREIDAARWQRRSSIDSAMDAASLLNSPAGPDEVVCYSVLDGDYAPDYKGAGYLAYSMGSERGYQDWLLVENDSHGRPLTPNNLCQLMLVLQGKRRDQGIEYLKKYDRMGGMQPLPADSLPSASWQVQVDEILKKLYEHASIVLQGEQKALMISLDGIGHELGANGVTIMDPSTGQCLAVSSLALADVIQRCCAPTSELPPSDAAQAAVALSRRQSTVSVVSAQTKNMRMRAQLEAVYGRGLADVVQRYYPPESDAPQSSAPVSRRPSLAAGAGVQTESMENHDDVGRHLADVPLRHDDLLLRRHSPGEVESLSSQPAPRRPSAPAAAPAATSAEIEVMSNNVPDHKGAGYLAYLMESEAGELDWLVVPDDRHASPLQRNRACLLAMELQDMQRDQGVEFLKNHDRVGSLPPLAEFSFLPPSWQARSDEIRDPASVPARSVPQDEEEAPISAGLPQPIAGSGMQLDAAIQPSYPPAQDALPSDRPVLRRQSMVDVAAAETASVGNPEDSGQAVNGYLIHYLPRSSQVNTGYLDEV